MKKLYLLIFTALSFATGVVNCSAQTSFQRVILANRETGGYVVKQTSDGGFIVAGKVYDVDSTYYDAYLVKTNDKGEIEWKKTYGGDNVEGGFAVEQTTDGGYVMSGVSKSFGQLNDIYVVKTDANGDTLWSKVYGGFDDDIGYFVSQTFDGGYVIGGYTFTYGGGQTDAYLLKISSTGSLLWSKTYGSSSYEVGYAAKQTADSGFIITGYTVSSGAGNSDVYLIKTDADGDTLWSKTYGGPLNDYGYYVEQTADHGYIVAGITGSFGEPNGDVYLIKTDASGDTLWTRTYGGASFDAPNEVHQTTDGGYIIPGVTVSYGAGDEDAYLIKTNASGDTLWTRTYGSIKADALNSGNQTADGGYILAGTTLSFDTVDTQGAIYLIKTDATGNSGCLQGRTQTVVGRPATETGRALTDISTGGAPTAVATIVGAAGRDTVLCLAVGIEELNGEHVLTIYPNPAGNQLTVNGFSTSVNAVEIYNTVGQACLQSEIKKPKSEIKLDIAALPAGVYIVRIISAGVFWTGKFIKE